MSRMNCITSRLKCRVGRTNFGVSARLQNSNQPGVEGVGLLTLGLLALHVWFLVHVFSHKQHNVWFFSPVSFINLANSLLTNCSNALSSPRGSSKKKKTNITHWLTCMRLILISCRRILVRPTKARREDAVLLTPSCCSVRFVTPSGVASQESSTTTVLNNVK